MTRHSNVVVWRWSIAAVMAAVVSGSIRPGDTERVDTEAMLDVSVSIKTISHVSIDPVGDSVWKAGSGSGFLISRESCEVWTNHHVVEDAAVINVFPRSWDGGAGIPATVVNSTPRNDVAILRMAHCEDIPEARLGNSATVAPGDETYAVGNPLGHNPDSISRGIISHTERFVTGSEAYLQTDAAINPGNSGGALFNRAGEVVGINTAIAASKSGRNIGIGYAIPINVARAVVSMLHAGPPSWGDARLDGRISSLTPEEAAVFRVPVEQGAVIVTQAPEDGPGAGVLEQHDVIFRAGGVDVVDAEQLERLLSGRDAGAEVALDIVRGGEPMVASITLAEGWQAAADPDPDFYEGFLGMTLEMWSSRDDELSRFDKPIIARVHDLGPAHHAQISSSQRTIGFRGPFMMPYQLDVKTITGVVVDGTYHAVSNLGDVERLSLEAYAAEAPLLLEIELWTRENPLDVEKPLERKGTAFFRIEPRITTAESPVELIEDVYAGEEQQASPAPATAQLDDAFRPAKLDSVWGWQKRFM